MLRHGRSLQLFMKPCILSRGIQYSSARACVVQFGPGLRDAAVESAWRRDVFLLFLAVCPNSLTIRLFCFINLLTFMKAVLCTPRWLLSFLCRPAYASSSKKNYLIHCILMKTTWKKCRTLIYTFIQLP